MSFDPTVSVIIPTYNRGRTLGRAINSVLNQTYSDFELIVVDDCSSDNTFEIVNNYKDERIRYIGHDINRGEGAARNTGIRNSHASYIAFLDSDDEWFPDKLSKQLPIIEGSPSNVGVVYSHYLMQYEDGSHVKLEQPNMRGNIFLELLSGNCFLPSSAIIKRECFDNHLHDESLPNFQDWDLWLSIAQEYCFDYISEPLCTIYRGTPNQASTNIKTRLLGLNLFMAKWGDLIIQYIGKGQIRKIKDKIIASLYTTVSESINAGNRVLATRHFLRLALRNGDFYRGPGEVKAIVYNLSLIVLGMKVHGIVIRFLKSI